MTGKIQVAKYMRGSKTTGENSRLDEYIYKTIALSWDNIRKKISINNKNINPSTDPFHIEKYGEIPHNYPGIFQVFLPDNLLIPVIAFVIVSKA